MYFTLPKDYREAPRAELEARISEAKARLGERLCILAHHYQREELTPFGDYLGDSYSLAQIAASKKDVEVIVFCGVHFMAESADILSDEKQMVFLPNPLAGCPMADMAEMADVLGAWEELKEFGSETNITPVSYMNTAAGLKAFTGRNGGLICTSSNAAGALKWALAQREKVFFFPDENLGYNTGLKYGLTPDQMVLWDFSRELGGLTPDEIRAAKIILWKGHCHVHTTFKLEHIERLRREKPECQIVVHPECTPDVVQAADADGSTSFIVDYCAKAKPGSMIAIGTEINLINRMASTYPDKTIVELSGETCPVCANMYRTTLNDLAYCLENYEDLKPIVVPEETSREALIALEKMLEIK